MAQLKISYDEIISVENLLAAWQEFLPGKRGKKDVQEFSLKLTDNILLLHQDLANFSYAHGGYKAFNISDPKPRNIHKPIVRDRVLHHAVYKKLYPFFDKVFIADCYSCRNDKGTHKAIDRFKGFCLRAGKNNTRTVWALKCDIKKFFASIDHFVLLKILAFYIPDQNIVQLLEKIILSFQSGNVKARGLPLGNLTSQLFCNIYMNRFDQFVKHKLKAKYYIRYADDFVFLSSVKIELVKIIPQVAEFLAAELKLKLHPDKVFIKTIASGVDFLGWINFPHHRVLRTATKRRMFNNIKKKSADPILQSYLGLIKHGNSFKLRQELLNFYGLSLHLTE